MAETPITQINKQPPPRTISRWNWGAMLLNVVWGAKHNVDFAFLTLIPVLGLIVPFILGMKGNEWAWKNGRWANAAQFEAAQKNWAFWGFVTWFFIFVALFIPVLHGIINMKWERSEVYQKAVAEFIQIEKIKMLLGSPIKSRIYEVKKFSNNRGRIGVKLKGSNTAFKVRFYILKINQQWVVYRLTLFNPRTKSGIDFPLPYNMLMYGAGNKPEEIADKKMNYDVILKDVGEAEVRSLAAVISALNPELEESEALDLVRFAPKRIFTGATRIGALKLKQKLEDYGAVVEIEENPLPK